MSDLNLLEKQIKEMRLLLVDEAEAIVLFIKKYMYPSDRRALGEIDDSIINEFRRELTALKKSLNDFAIEKVYEVKKGFAIKYDGSSTGSHILFVWNKSKKQFYFRGVMAIKLSSYGVNFYF